MKFLIDLKTRSNYYFIVYLNIFFKILKFYIISKVVLKGKKTKSTVHVIYTFFYSLGFYKLTYIPTYKLKYFFT